MARDAERAAHVAAAAAQAQFAEKLAGIAGQASNTRTTGFRVPVVDSDPGLDFPTNLWGFDDGRIRWRGTDGAVHELAAGYPLLSLSSNPAASSGIDIYRHSTSDELRVRRPDGTWAAYASKAATSTSDSTQGGSTTTKPRQTDTAPTRKRRTYAATWGRTFCATHGVETGTDLRYGVFAGSSHGMRRIMVGFDDAAIRSALAGASIKAVELHMTNTDSWAHAGIDVRFGAHNRSAPPAAYSAVRRGAYTGHWPESGDGVTWRSVSRWFGTAFRDGTIRGLTIDQPAGDAYYGEMRWPSVRLRITFTS